jgi:predicted RNase H-like nuclease
MRYVGVDSCRAGWFWVALSDGPDWAIGVAPGAAELAALAGNAQLILIDIPVGLFESGSEERRCDRDARALLGRPRAASVFRVPVRPVLTARDHARANRRSRRLAGVGLSRQTWGIVPKIRDVDRLLRARPGLRAILRETHPEVCFWSLNDRRAMAHGKKTAAGRRERLKVLRASLPQTGAIVRAAVKRFRRGDVARDDILDALVAALTAKLARVRPRTLPARPPRDAFGLPMQIVYAGAGYRRNR